MKTMQYILTIQDFGILDGTWIYPTHAEALETYTAIFDMTEALGFTNQLLIDRVSIHTDWVEHYENV